jgi:hypothetical protein
MDLKELTNEIHRIKLKTFETRKVEAKYVFEILGCDLVDLSFWSEKNDGYKFLLTVVDVLSKYAWAFALKNKSADEVVKAFEDLFKEVIPKKLWTDQGSEFYNKKIAALLKKHHIELYSSYGAHKSCVVERFNRTLRGRMFKEFTKNNNRVWIHILPKLIKNYNNTKHSTIKMKPIDAILPKNYKLLIHNFNNKVKIYRAPELKVGDYVRISRVKELFEKGETRNWSLEVFKISKVIKTYPITYHIEEYDGSPIEGAFYEEELQKTDLLDTYLVEKVLKERKYRGKKQYFVKWMGWPAKYNSWVDANDVVGDFDEE